MPTDFLNVRHLTQKPKFAGGQCQQQFTCSLIQHIPASNPWLIYTSPGIQITKKSAASIHCPGYVHCQCQ